MVTLVQHYQQSTPDANQHQQDQDPQSDIPVENGDSEDCSKALKVAKNTAIDVFRNGSLAGSSTQCSDVENEEGDETEADGEEGTEADEEEWIPDLPVPTVFQQEVISANGNLVLPNADTSNFGDVRVKNSTNVHLGNKTFYKGPVTIKQFVYTNPAIQDLDEVKIDNTRSSDTSTTDYMNNGDSPTSNSTSSQNPDKVTKWLWTWQCSAFLSVLALFFVTVVVIVSVYYARSTTVTAPVFPQMPSPGFEEKPSRVRFVTRDEWGAQPSSAPLEPLKHPVPYVIISHTATDFCTTQAACTFRVRFAQTFHIESRNWHDIAYNFLVGGDGLAYVGRGWDYVGAHSFLYNNISIGISCIGTFNNITPSKTQLYALSQLIQTGVELGKIAKDFKLIGHRQISKTLSPGEALYAEIIKWPNWSPVVN